MIKILFVCMGNICRSPAAEAIFRHYVNQNRLDALIEVDSAGTHGYHSGEAPDSRTQRAAWMRGYDLSQIRARKVAPQDIDYFDLIIAMDKANLDNLKRLCVPAKHEKLQLFMQYASRFDDVEVPDPYYGLGHGFDLVIDMVEDAAQGLLTHVKQRLTEKRLASGYVGKEWGLAARNDPLHGTASTSGHDAHAEHDAHSQQGRHNDAYMAAAVPFLFRRRSRLY